MCSPAHASTAEFEGGASIARTVQAQTSGSAFGTASTSQAHRLSSRPAAATSQAFGGDGLVEFKVPEAATKSEQAAAPSSQAEIDPSVWAAEQFELGSIPENAPPLGVC